MTKRMMAALLLHCLLVMQIPLGATATENETAYAQVFYDGNRDINITSKTFINPATPVYDVKDGVPVAVLGTDAGAPQYIGVNVKDGLFSSKENTSVKITVRYFDEVEGFALIRHSVAGESYHEVAPQFMKGTGTWQEMTFYLDRCAFWNGEANANDFLLARWTRDHYQMELNPEVMSSATSTSPMYVQWIKVEETYPQNLMDVTVTTDHYGNIFDGGDDKVLYVNSTNWYSAPTSATMRWRVLDFYHNLVDPGGQVQVEFDAGEAKVLEVRPSVSRYDAYLLELTWDFRGEYKNGIGESTSEPHFYNFSIMNKTKPGEEGNRMVKTVGKFEFGWYEDTKAFTDVLSAAGFTGIRDDWRWADAERSKGVYAIPATLGYDGITHRTEPFDWITPVEENLGDIMYCFMLSNPLYISSTPRNGMPDDELWPGSEQAFFNYVDWVSKTFKDKIKYYQFWNEPQGTHFNGNNTSPEKYAALMKKFYEVVKRNDPEGQVVGLAVAYTPSANWVRRALAAGAADYMDAASTHPYDWDGLFTAADYASRIKEFKSLFAEVGHPDMPIHLTEMGIREMASQGFATVKGQAEQVAQSFIVTQGEELADLYYYFTAIENFPKTKFAYHTGDSRWGIFNHQNEQEPYSARPAAISTAAYNKMIGNATILNKWSDYEMENGSYVYHFKRESDGKDVVVYWTEEGSRTFGLNLGANQAEFYDIFSNYEGMLHATNGVFTLTSSAEPTYLVGDFSKFEMTDSQIITNGGRHKSTYNDVTEINYTDLVGRDLRAEVVVDDNLKLLENKGIVNGKGQVRIGTTDTFYQGNESSTVKLYYGNNMVYAAKYHFIESKQPISFSATSERYSETSDRFVLNLTVNNDTQGLKFTGDIIADLSDFGGGKQSRHLVNLKPTKSATLRYNLPIAYAKGAMQIPIQCNLKDDSGTKIPADGAVVTVVPDLRCIYADTPPNITGKYTRSEWTGGDWFKADDLYAASKYIDWSGKNDASFEGTVLWDEEYMYLLLETRDDRFYNPYEGGSSWQGDGFQLGVKSPVLGALDLENKNFTEVGIYHSTDGSNKMYRYGVQFSSMGNAADYVNCDISMEKIGGKWIYRAAIPWVSIVGEDTPIEENLVLRMAMLYNDNDGAGRNYLEFNTGIAGTKSSEKFSAFTLVKK